MFLILTATLSSSFNARPEVFSSTIASIKSFLLDMPPLSPLVSSLFVEPAHDFVCNRPVGEQQCPRCRLKWRRRREHEYEGVTIVVDCGIAGVGRVLVTIENPCTIDDGSGWTRRMDNRPRPKTTKADPAAWSVVGASTLMAGSGSV